jgi:hypothetical protein
LPEGEQLAGLGDLMTGLSSLGAGCAAVGVDLPPDFFQARPL